MDQAFLHEFARRCREMMAGARTEAARRQLAMWVEEFEQRAETVERELGKQARDDPKPG